MQKVLWQSRHTWRSRATVCCLKGEPIYSDGSSLTLSELGSFAVKSVAMFVLRLAGFLSFLLQAAAYPTSMACDFACMGGYTPGSTFGYMGVANIGATSGDTCKIATDVPSGGYTPGTSYMVTVTSTTALAQNWCPTVEVSATAWSPTVSPRSRASSTRGRHQALVMSRSVLCVVPVAASMRCGMLQR